MARIREGLWGSYVIDGVDYFCTQVNAKSGARGAMGEARFCGTRLWSDEREDRYRHILLYWSYISVQGFTVSMGPTMLLATLRDYVREHSEVLRPGRHRIYTWDKHVELHAIRASEGWIRYHMCNSRQSGSRSGASIGRREGRAAILHRGVQAATRTKFGGDRDLGRYK